MKLKGPISKLEKIENYCRNLFNIAPSHTELMDIEEDTWVAPPRVNIRLTEQGYDLEIDMPGFERDEVEVTITSGRLKVKAEKKPVEEDYLI